MQVGILNQMLTLTVLSLFGGSKSPLFQRKSKQGPVKAPTKLNAQEWLQRQAPKRLHSSLQKLKKNLSQVKSVSMQSLNYSQLLQQKTKVKSELKKYDGQFQTLYKRLPNRKEKEPLRPLYLYYKRIKESLDKFSGTEAQKIELQIRQLEESRMQVRKKIEEYQGKFEQENNRRIRYLRDIQPIQKQYNIYKQIKAKIQQLYARLKLL